MGEDKKSFMGEMSTLAQMSEMIEKSELFSADSKIVIHQPEEQYRKILSHFREMDRNKDSFIISISGTDFTFVLKK